MIAIYALIRLNNSHAALFKLMSFETNLSDFHTLSKLCPCKGPRPVEHSFLKFLLHVVHGKEVAQAGTL